ncbi:restriction endonuclease subunit S [Ralstonia pseudosolanacearum]
MEVKEPSVRYFAKPASKQTDVGVIPEDWELQPISSVAKVVRGGSPRPAGDPKYFNGSFIPWLTVASLTNIPDAQLTVSETSTCLTEEGAQLSRTLTPGTLIIANSGATLGVAKILGIKCCANDGIAALQHFHKNISTRYVAHYINTRTKHLREVVATGNGQPNLNTGLIRDKCSRKIDLKFGAVAG